jgi:voltage-gated potassium channel
VQATLNPGVTRVVSELLSYQEGQELYAIPVPAPLIGTTFLKAMAHFKQHYDTLLIALQRHDGQTLTNPAATYEIEEKDRLFVVSAERPQLS